eukprot:gene19415-26072_t
MRPDLIRSGVSTLHVQCAKFVTDDLKSRAQHSMFGRGARLNDLDFETARQLRAWENNVLAMLEGNPNCPTASQFCLDFDFLGHLNTEWVRFDDRATSSGSSLQSIWVLIALGILGLGMPRNPEPSNVLDLFGS